MSAPVTYRGWSVTQGSWPEPGWGAVSPNYDASYEGPEDGWVDNGERASAATFNQLCEEIDAWFEENGPPALREIIAAEINVGDRYAIADRILAAMGASAEPTGLPMNGAASASPPSVGIPSAMLVTTSEVVGHLACWAVRQSPYAAPDNMREAMEQFIVAFPFDGEISMETFHMKRWDDFDQFYDSVWAAIEASPAIVAWNTPKSGHDDQIGFVSRYDRPEPDDDFIDLHALCRNVARGAWEEAEREAGYDAAQGTPTRSAETTGSVGEADGGAVATPCAQTPASTKDTDR